MIRMFVVKVYFVLLNYIFLKPLVRALSFCYISLLYDFSFIFCCMFLKGLGKHLPFRLDQIVSHFIFFANFNGALKHVFIYHALVFKAHFTILHFYNIFCLKCLGMIILQCFSNL